MKRASFIGLCSANGQLNIWRLNFCNFGSESYFLSKHDDFVNCAIFAIVVSLCRSFA